MKETVVFRDWRIRLLKMEETVVFPDKGNGIVHRWRKQYCLKMAETEAFGDSGNLHNVETFIN